MGKNRDFDIRFIEKSEWEEAMAMVYRTFLEFDAHMFTQEGIDNFREFISDTALKHMFENGNFQVIGAYDGRKLIGIIALRENRHISLLFVEKDYHRLGVGRKLVQELSDYAYNKLHETLLTVNASPYATEFYHRLGFLDISPSVSTDGIIFTPMKYILGD